ncbi:peroxiredoxin-like family protein [Allorhizocola rhizosphaerae]|uniref:peroxiredoxin-like family protein n=1 Tax=Allorhizocola rhizosphaerae TaxID=1872709 RepID=UPI001FEAB85C|nr:peroxiredoxin-like family protein [Allorhizocola rhizosphaerae]
MARIHNGQSVEPLRLESVSGAPLAIPDPDRLIHLQFRRYAGCPICNLHMRSITRRIDEINAAGIQEVGVFGSSAAELRRHQGDIPFPVVADPSGKLYTRFGVGKSWRSLLHPGAWRAALLGGLTGKGGLPRRGERLLLGLPADFLIEPSGHVVAHHYGEHADDQWSVDELLAVSRSRAIRR